MKKFRNMLQGKIHGATVTHANLQYEGSVTIPASLLSLAGMLPNEMVSIWNITNGARFETYTIIGKEEGVICINGAAARLVQPTDKIIIAAFSSMDEEAAKTHRPSIVFLDENNRVKMVRDEVSGPEILGQVSQ